MKETLLKKVKPETLEKLAYLKLANVVQSAGTIESK